MLNNDKYFYFFCESDLKAQSKMLMLKPEIFSVNECVLGWGGGVREEDKWSRYYL